MVSEPPRAVSICADKSKNPVVVWRAWHFRTIFESYAWDKNMGGYVFSTADELEKVVKNRWPITWVAKM